MRKILLTSVATLAIAALNFSLFIASYNKLATPFLHEEQRVENAQFIMTFTLGGYIALAVVSVVVAFFLSTRGLSRSSHNDS